MIAPLQKIRFGCDLPALFEEICLKSSVRDSAGVIFGLSIAKVSLAKIAKRAIEIQDMVILEELENIECVNREVENETI
jgi:hypothetical protein